MRRKNRPDALMSVVLAVVIIALALPLLPVGAGAAAVERSAQSAADARGLPAEQTSISAVSSAPQLLVQGPVQTAVASAAAAPTNTVYLRVVNARSEPLALDGAGVIKGEPVTTEYQYMINVDNTGDPTQDYLPGCHPFLDPPDNTQRNPDYPDSCDWPGIRTVPGWAPIYTQGTQDDLNETTGITLPDGKYLISVMADGYKVDGEHFTVPLEEPGLIEVQAHALPLPPATIVIKVFHDRSMTNGQFDAPVEQGLSGFRASLNDIAGEITADLFGNPLCTEYEKDTNGDVVLDSDGAPVIQTLGAGCYSDDEGLITIPNIGPMRYDVLVIPPDGEQWAQTTTLEGSQGWDTWLQEAGTGLDNEFLIAAEPFPWTIFGFVAPTNTLTVTTGTGTVRGVIMAASIYIPSIGGLPHQGDIWGGLDGVKLEFPIEYPWISLNDLQNGDTAVWVGQGNADGSFEIPNVPPGDYFVSYWDEKQHYILDFVQITVQADEVTDIGIRPMTGWFTEWYGTVFNDINENGRRDPGEPGVSDYLVVLRDRDNTEIDRMSIASVTDANGDYALEKGYPMGSWMVLEAYNDLYRTTGITFQASNQPTETTVLGGGVDVSVLPTLSQRGRLDWGVKPYEQEQTIETPYVHYLPYVEGSGVGTVPPEEYVNPHLNGGIVGSVFYDTVRAEDNARYAGAEPWQPGTPDLEMRLYATVKDAQGNPITDTTPGPNFGAYLKGPLLATTVTEHFVRPKNCQARDVNGDPIDIGVFPPSTGDYDCLEGMAMGVQFGAEFAELDGNWGFTEIYTDPVSGLPIAAPFPIPEGDYLVEVVIPKDPVTGRDVFQVTREEDVNIYTGDTFVPLIPPPACAGPLHVVDVAGIAPDGPLAVHNPDYVDVGGSRYEGQLMPLCNVKLVELRNGRSVAPLFTLFTPVPIPGKWKGYIIDDLNISTNPLELFFGEKVGLGNMPIGIYDFTGRLVHTVHSDMHGVYEVILPSDATVNAPTPSGMLASVYYIYGNDPGQPGNYNANYNPQYRSIGTSFEIYPGVIVPSDLAPIQNGVGIWSPTSQVNQLAQCRLDDTTPQIFAVSQPYVQETGTFTIDGLGFGATLGSGSVRLGSIHLPIESWSDRQIVASVPPSVPEGEHQLSVWSSNGQSTINGLTFHVLGAGYNPTIYEVGATQMYTMVQDALDAAATAGADALVVVYPGVETPLINPLGIYFENPVVYSPVKLQGVGPGGVYTDGTAVKGSVLDGRGVGGDTPYSEFWRTLVGDIWLNRGGWDGGVLAGDDPRIYEGPVVTVFAEDGEFTSAYRASIDGFTIQGGDQQGFPNNLNKIGGGRIPGVPAEVSVQGGGIFVNGYARYLQITNNVIQSNGGAYAGAIRLGTPDVPEPLTDHQNDFVRIAYNRILANGGTNLAGAIGLFAGAEGYEVAHNDICGNFSAEYGGGISHYGFSPNGAIHHNRVYFNRSYDEGGGIMIAGELPADFTQLSPGAGPVDIYANLIQANLGNDDGGGVRFLMAGNFPFNVYNNMVVNNISTHEGGGISINDAPDVRVYNNTIVKNLTTATAMTSNGQAAPAGLSTSRNSALLQATLPVTAPAYSDPLMFNNIFWDNRAGVWTGGGVAGIGLEGDPFPIFYWDLGLADRSAVLHPTYSILQVAYGASDPGNLIGVDPQVVSEYDVSVRVYPWRGNPSFIGADIVAVDLPASLLGDYHLAAGSPAIDAGVISQAGIDAPGWDFDDDPRPSAVGYDIGADEDVIETSNLAAGPDLWNHSDLSRFIGVGYQAPRFSEGASFGDSSGALP
ncbi:MAG: hypothetical protein GX620_06265 [Chloroflexi bacterium]|nr:hypothetical protein [Chloroflexota bacterium]